MITPLPFSFTRKLMFFLFLFGFTFNSLTAQKVANFIGERKSTNFESELDAVFTAYDIFEINSNAISNYVGEANGNPLMLKLALGNQYDWEILMYENELINENYFLTEKTDNGNIISSRRSVKTFSGYLQANEGGTVGLTIDEHFILGLIHHGNQSYFIEPLNRIAPDAPNDLFVVYNIEDVIQEPNVSCGVTDIAKYRVMAEQSTQGLSSQMDPCSELELALAADRSMFDNYGSVVSAENYLIGIWNLVAPDYTGWFSQDIEFNIVTILVISGTDPWFAGNDASTLLGDFRSWGENGNFGVNFDLGQLWTDRNISNDGNSSVVGLAYVGVVCTGFKYSLIEDFSGNSNTMRQTVSHEVGHNFDASHDGGNTNIMAPTINGSSSWSTNSVSEISAHIDTRSCFEDCLQCLEITLVEVQNCGGGSYNLEVCIEHAGRTNQSNLQITANGSTSTFSFNTTGTQCEVITGLPANSTANAVLTVEDTNDNDVECTKTVNYDAPHPDCICSSILSENFNALSLPTGWTNVGTGNNPNGQWDFGTATFGVNSAAGSFDGSGMAFWDDDANGATNNGSEYMELTTPELDLSNYELISLDFDYNFWTYDGQDIFLVDVWNGNSWINLLTTNETNCGAWGCDYPHFRANLDNYANPEFKLRFTYDDSGNSWQWWAAIDNVEICGFQLVALPIDLLAFDGIEKDCTVELDWRLGAESTSDIFEIERSFDGQNFELIGSINGLSSTDRTYSFVDNNPGYENFYRLKTTDETGAINYSSIKSITATSCKEGALDIVDVFPNPTKGELFFNIHSIDASNVIVEIRNAAGILVEKSFIELTPGMNQHTIDTDKLAIGMYYIQVTSDYGNSTLKKFVKE